jgi:hypothetical protein
VEVTEVNSFGEDFLALCDGSRSSAEIAARLYGRYGAGMDAARFCEECFDALAVFTEMGIVCDGAGHPPVEAHPPGRRCGVATAAA